MKPFNLQEAIEGKPLVTRDGRKVLDFHYFKDINSEENYCISAIIESEKLISSFTKDGTYRFNGVSQSDLFMDGEEKNYYIAVYEKDNKGNFTLVNSLESPFKQGQTIEITIP